jgi:predicted O-methyltransferase YrrM
MEKTVEDRTHRSHDLNPRRWPRGAHRAPITPEEQQHIRQYSGQALLSEPEMELIYHLAKLQGDGLYANLGHALGASAILMSDGLSAGGHLGLVHSYDIAKQKGLALPVNVLYHRRSTLVGAEEMQDEVFRLVFVDADHTFDSVVKDFQAWWPLLDEDGLIAFHDTNQDFSHAAIDQYVLPVARELEDLHVDRIRVFGR